MQVQIVVENIRQKKDGLAQGNLIIKANMKRTVHERDIVTQDGKEMIR